MIGIIVINYKTYLETIKCVESILKTATIEYKIYVLDNGSQNDSFDILSQKYGNDSRVLLIKSDNNLGFARGNNLCLRKAETDNCDAIIISNNDIIFLDGAIDKLYQSIKDNSEYVLIGPKVYYRSTNMIQRSIKNRMPSFLYYLFHETYLRNLLPHNGFKKLTEFKNFQPVFWVSGCCFIVNLEKFKEIEYFDEYTFLYFEEYIISFKAKLKNFLIGYDPSAMVIHYHGVSSGGALNLETRRENFRSEMYFMKKYWKTGKIKRWIIWLIRYMEVAFNYRHEDNKRYAKKDYYMQTKKIRKHPIDS